VSAVSLARSIRAFVRALAVAALLSRAALAQTPPPPAGAPRPARPVSDADRQEARRHIDRGDEAMAQGRFREALDAYRRAEAIVAVPTTLLEVGRAHFKLGELVAARGKLRQAAEFVARPDEPPVFQKARGEAAALAADIDRRIPKVILHVRTRDGSTPVVHVDGAPLAPAELGRETRLDARAHEIVASAPGHRSARVRIELAEGEARVIDLALEPGADEPPGSGISPLVYVGFAVAGAGALVGTITGVVHLSETSDLKDECPQDRCPPDQAEARDDVILLANVSNVSFAVGAAGLVLGVVGIVLSGSDEGSDASPEGPATGAVVEPLVGLGSLGVRGRF
jgi:hypothetical protein